MPTADSSTTFSSRGSGSIAAVAAARPRIVLAAGASRGGVADVFRRVVVELQRRGHRVEVVEVPTGRIPALTAVATAYAARRAIASAVTVHLEFGSNDVELFWFALAVVLMRRDCVVVAHDYPKLSHAPAAALVPASSRWLRAIAYRVLSPSFDRLLVRALVRRAGVLAVFGDEAREGWLAQGAARVELIPHGGERPHASLRPPSTGESVLFAGFIGPHKGVDVLIEAWRRVNALVELPLVIAGGAGTPQTLWMRDLAQRAAELPNPPRFLGPVPRERDFQELINRAAIVVLPYRFSSPASGVLVRAMSAGRAVIATPVPAAKQAIVTGQNGLLLPLGDPVALADSILALYRSPEERDRLGRAAAETAAKLFTWNGHLDGLERAYRLVQHD